MFPKRSREVSSQRLYTSSRRTSSAILTLFAVACLVWQVIFSDSASSSPSFLLFVTICGLVLVQAFALGQQTPSNYVKALQLSTLYAVLITIFSTIIALPSPYLLCFVVLAILTYFDFGLLAMNIGLAVVLAALSGNYVHVHGVHMDARLLATIVVFGLVALIVHYCLSFLRFAEVELTVVDKASAKALSHEQQVQSLINNITDGVIALDHNFKVVIYNAAALDVLDINTTIKGKPINKLFRPIDAERQRVSMQEVLAATTKPTINRDLRVQYKDGSVANLFIGIAPIYLGYGKAANNGFTLIMRDITREKSLEEERDEFISVVSHELRTPIAISEGNISNAQFVVSKGGDVEEVKQALDEAHKQVLFLADMINDLSTLSRAERGILEVDAEPIDLQAFMTELTNNYTPQAEAKGLKFVSKVDPDLKNLVSSRLYVREVLQNFITNAIKYTEKGTITFSAVANAKGVTFAVHDTGIGISKGDQERVYDKFFRSEDYRTRKNSGTGLGLYVTMKLARLIHATVSLDSELNKGSTFTVMIPNFQTESSSST